MSDEKEKTNRGFRVYGRIQCSGYPGLVRVQESSMAGESAHVWLFLDGESCSEHLGRHHKPEPHLNVAGAKLLRDALNQFIAEAEDDELTELTEAP